jgi:tungstate transport system permease protein
VDEIFSGLARAVNMLGTGDPAVLEIIWLSLFVTGVALAISTLIGVPTGAVLGLWSRIRIRG